MGAWLDFNFFYFLLVFVKRRMINFQLNNAPLNRFL